MVTTITRTLRMMPPADSTPMMKRAAHDIEVRKRTDDVLLSDGIYFSSLLLSQAVLDGLSSSGFQKPSPIQLKAIPLGRCGLDLIVQAKSGTGKTCVFCTIALDFLVLENPTTQVLVLAPTREIAVQIHSVFMAIGCAMEGLECHVFIGGRAVSQDKHHLKKCHIAVGSPGRIKQLIELGMLSTSSIRLFVLDEADKLLEEGSFQEQINWIFSSLPENKQMLALSATYPESLAQHLTRYMREPTFVRLNPTDMGLKGLKQYYKLVQSHSLPHKVFEEKVQHLLELFSKIPFNQALVFSNLHTRAQHLADILSSKGLPAVCISGGLSQDQRLEAMSKLKQYQCRVLISTDLTSRGIDADKVNLVINLDLPQDWETYMHRIGRAGRFGTQGLAVTYCCHGEEENKLMSIAQKCSLNLSLLPAVLESRLMDDPCDWDVCAEAATPVTLAKLSSKTERKKHPKLAVDPGEQSNGHRKPEKAPPAPTPAATFEETRRTLASTKEDCVQGAQQAGPTRKELQDRLPKIPPLSSFKSCRPRFVTLEEAELDFHGFITTGPGRSVDVIREYGGQEDGEHSVHNECITLDDDSSECLKLCRKWRKSGQSHPRSISSSSSSPSDRNVEKVAAVSEPQTEARRAAAVPAAKEEPKHTSSEASVPRKHPSSDATLPKPENYNPSGAVKRNVTEMRNREHVGRNEGERDEEEEERSAEAYWRATYRAWNDYYASVSAFQSQGYPSCYGAAHSWMAAYRMNAVYMEELLKD
uniref:RNA helicase n=1 Tax=Takifugu rubripes TaxID=31033 RepID=A0A674NL56_TAKRU